MGEYYDWNNLLVGVLRQGQPLLGSGWMSGRQVSFSGLPTEMTDMIGSQSRVLEDVPPTNWDGIPGAMMDSLIHGWEMCEIAYQESVKK
jgi:hypothetical protein